MWLILKYKISLITVYLAKIHLYPNSSTHALNFTWSYWLFFFFLFKLLLTLQFGRQKKTISSPFSAYSGADKDSCPNAISLNWHKILFCLCEHYFKKNDFRQSSLLTSAKRKNLQVKIILILIQKSVTQLCTSYV